jgi:hypothetical protein
VALPEFRTDGCLPVGVHQATESEVLFRFGSGNRRRRTLALRLRRWLDLARAVGASRFLVGGSFVTAKHQPGDLDAVILLPPDFEQRVQAGHESAVELYRISAMRRPEDLFLAEDASDWENWCRFLGRARGAEGHRKGVVEILLL